MNKNNLNFIFWGTPEVASETLKILKENGYIPSLIVTAPDRPKGRKMVITPPPVKLWAIENNIPYLQPEDLKGVPDVVFKSIAQVDEPNIAISQQGNMHGFKNNTWPELSIVVAYGKIIPEKIINLPKLGSINVHYSLLPKYRGASPVESAILNGEKEIGISIQKMKYKLDSGPIMASEKIKIKDNEKTYDLRKRLIKIGGELLVKILPDFIDGKVKLTLQNENKVTFCKKIKKEDGLIDLNDKPEKNYNKFKAYATWPRTFFFKEGKRTIITDAVLKNGQFIIKKVIPEGGKEKDYKD